MFKTFRMSYKIDSIKNIYLYLSIYMYSHFKKWLLKHRNMLRETECLSSIMFSFTGFPLKCHVSVLLGLTKKMFSFHDLLFNCNSLRLFFKKLLGFFFTINSSTTYHKSHNKKLFWERLLCCHFMSILF